ncbi:NUDIX hydrolase [Candidatus Woesearchaeota archaeon]|nr:NUDIX hydrolase [Candidatus Woesearchaeota archaeon]
MADKKPVYPAMKALIVDGDKFLLVLNDEDKWEFPGGKVDYGETPFDALHREIKEELGIGIEIFEPVGLCWSIIDTREVVMTVIRCKAKSLDFDTTKNPANEEIKEVRFFTKEEFLKDEIIEAHKNMKELISKLDL